MAKSNKPKRPKANTLKAWEEYDKKMTNWVKSEKDKKDAKKKIESLKNKEYKLK